MPPFLKINAVDALYGGCGCGPPSTGGGGGGTACPKGSVQNRSGSCEEPPECPSGQTWDDVLKACNDDAVTDCPSGQTWDDVLKACGVSETCPVGQVMQGVPGFPMLGSKCAPCPGGFDPSFDGLSCVSRCPGQTWDDNLQACAPPPCQSGYSRDANGVCVADVAVVCDGKVTVPNAKLTDDGKIRFLNGDIISEDYYCVVNACESSGMAWDDNLQACVLAAPPPCQSGYFRDANGVCILLTTPCEDTRLVRNPDGVCVPDCKTLGLEYTPDNLLCVPDPNCLPGQKRGPEGQCLYGACEDGLVWNIHGPNGHECVKPVTECQEGYILSNGSCIIDSRCPGKWKWDDATGACKRPKVVDCPPGQISSDGVCVYPASVTDPGQNVTADLGCAPYGLGYAYSHTDPQIDIGSCQPKDWPGWLTERPFARDSGDDWIVGNADICKGQANLKDVPPGQLNISKDGKRIRWPNGFVESEGTLCKSLNLPPTFDECFYSSAENPIIYGFDLSALLVGVGLPPLPSLDQSICDDKKTEILNAILQGLQAPDDAMSFNALEKLFDDPLAGVSYLTGLGGSWHNYAAAAISFGMGDFGEAVVNLMEAIPYLGPLLGGAIRDLGGLEDIFDSACKATPGCVELRKFLNDRLPGDIKGRIIDAVVDGLELAAMIPNPASPIIIPVIALVKSLIIFGQRKWDEAVIELITLGLGQVAGRLIKGATGAFKSIMKLFAGDGSPGWIAKNLPSMQKLIDSVAKYLTKLFTYLKQAIMDVVGPAGLKWFDANFQMTDLGKLKKDEASLLYSSYQAYENFHDGYNLNP